MRRGVQQWIAELVVYAVIPGCLLNTVQSITRAPRERPQLSLQGKDTWRMSLTRVGKVHATLRC
jgi:hypothetical protein